MGNGGRVDQPARQSIEGVGEPRVRPVSYHHEAHGQLLGAGHEGPGETVGLQANAGAPRTTVAVRPGPGRTRTTSIIPGDCRRIEDGIRNGRRGRAAGFNGVGWAGRTGPAATRARGDAGVGQPRSGGPGAGGPREDGPVLRVQAAQATETRERKARGGAGVDTRGRPTAKRLGGAAGRHRRSAGHQRKRGSRPLDRDELGRKAPGAPGHKRRLGRAVVGNRRHVPGTGRHRNRPHKNTGARRGRPALRTQVARLRVAGTGDGHPPHRQNSGGP